jgi:hypothetical protein
MDIVVVRLSLKSKSFLRRASRSLVARIWKETAYGAAVRCPQPNDSLDGTIPIEQ